jgi:hypothetical protein
MVGRDELDSQLMKNPMEGCCEHGNEHSDYTRDGELE